MTRQRDASAEPFPPADGSVDRPNVRSRPGTRVWLFALALGSAAVFTRRSAPEPSFTGTDDAAVQIAELTHHVAREGAPTRVIQVDLDAHPKVSQFDDIDASPSGYGRTACGPIAAAVALGGHDWPALLAEITAAAGDRYGVSTGIQPSPYAAALRRVFGRWAVRPIDRMTLGRLYYAVSSDAVVIVDIKVNDVTGLPSGEPPHYAHFARVLGIDLDEGRVYIDNTLHGPSYWTVDLETFVAAWRHPETSASLRLDPDHAEPVDRWAVLIDPIVRLR